MATKVVHVSKNRYDIYIGRGLCPVTNQPSKWGNPFCIGKDGSRMDCLRKHAAWLLDQPRLIASLCELKDKTLGCWCSPKACHGETLAKLADMSVAENFTQDKEWKAKLVESLFAIQVPRHEVQKVEGIFGKPE